MAEYIEREAALEAAKKSHLYFDIKPIINSIPAADVRPVVRGKWIGQRADSEMCSACWVRFYISALFAVGGNNEPNFCPSCGAEMERVE